MAGPVNLVLSPGDTVLVINNPDTEDRAELAATAAVAYIVGEILIIATANPSVKYQRVSMKRASYIICKQAAKEEKREIRGPRSHVFQALLPNIVSKRKDRHIARAITDCSSCNVVLCSRKECWETVAGYTLMSDCLSLP